MVEVVACYVDGCRMDALPDPVGLASPGVFFIDAGIRGAAEQDDLVEVFVCAYHQRLLLDGVVTRVSIAFEREVGEDAADA